VGSGQWAVGSGQWAVGSGQWAVGSGQWAVGSGQWAVGSGQWAVGRGQWAVGSGQWAVGSGQWAVGSGQWAVGSGQWAVGSGYLLSMRLVAARDGTAMLTWRRALAIIALALLLLCAGTAAAILHRGAVASPLLYRVPLGPNPTTITMDERTGVAFVADDNGVSVVDVHHGSLLRHIADTAPGHNAIVVDPRAGHAFVVGPDAATLSMLDARDGRLLRTIVVHRDGYGVPDETLQSVAVDDLHGRVVVVGDGADTLVSVLDSHSGAVLHTVAMPGSADGAAVDMVRQRAFVLAFDSLGSSTINAIDMRGGALLRTIVLGAPNATAPLNILADDRSGIIIVDDMRGNVRAFDDRTLHLVSAVNVGPLPGALVIDPRHGYLLAPSPINDSLSVLDPRRGVLLHTMNMANASLSGATGSGSGGANPVAAVMAYATFARGGPQALTIDSLTGCVLLTRTHYVYDPSDHRPLLDSGGIVMLDVTTGAIIRSVPTGADPVAVAVDHASGHLLVVDAGGVTLTHDPDPWGWTPDWLRRLLPWLPKPASHIGAVSPALDVIDLGQR